MADRRAAVYANDLPLDAMLLDATIEHGRRNVDDSKRRRRKTSARRSNSSRTKRRSVRILIDQVTSVVVLLLAMAAAISWLLGDYLEAAAIAGVLLINTAIGFILDLRAHRAMEALL